MKYKLNLSPKIDVTAPPVTGAVVSTPAPAMFLAWQPSTWLAAPAAVDEKFVYNLKRIFEDSILSEIANVIADAEQCNGDLQHRGHVVAIALMCALDAISSYGYKGKSVSAFIKAHFPHDYHAHADEIYKLYRNSLIHSWNLFEASIYPDDSSIRVEGGSIAFGLLNFFKALVGGAGDFLERLENDATLQKRTLARYKKLRKTAKP